MFFVANHKMDHTEKMILAANYLLEESGRSNNCRINTHIHMWFREVVIKSSSSINALCRASIINPWKKEYYLISDIKGGPVWVHFEFDMMCFSLDSLEQLEDVYAGAIKHFGESERA